jgi:hypothetical protein
MIFSVTTLKAAQSSKTPSRIMIRSKLRRLSVDVIFNIPKRFPRRHAGSNSPRHTIGFIKTFVAEFDVKQIRKLTGRVHDIISDIRSTRRRFKHSVVALLTRPQHKTLRKTQPQAPFD